MDQKSRQDAAAAAAVDTSKKGGDTTLLRKRGMKPKSQRNRKMIRSQAQTIEHNYKINVRRLELNGKPVATTSTGWLRTVEPYPYQFVAHAKGRWLGQTVLDVYQKEFGNYPAVRY